MCVVSMIGDYYRDTLPKQYPGVFPQQPAMSWLPQQIIVQGVSQAEFDGLKAEVERMKELLRRAKIYDEQNGEPDCEIDEKMDLLRKVAKLVGVDLNDVLKANPA